MHLEWRFISSAGQLPAIVFGLKEVIKPPRSGMFRWLRGKAPEHDLVFETLQEAQDAVMEYAKKITKEVQPDASEAGPPPPVEKPWRYRFPSFDDYLRKRDPKKPLRLQQELEAFEAGRELEKTND